MGTNAEQPSVDVVVERWAGRARLESGGPSQRGCQREERRGLEEIPSIAERAGVGHSATPCVRHSLPLPGPSRPSSRNSPVTLAQKSIVGRSDTPRPFPPFLIGDNLLG